MQVTRRIKPYNVTPDTTHVGTEPNVVVLTLVSVPDGPAVADAGTLLMVVVS